MQDRNSLKMVPVSCPLHGNFIANFEFRQLSGEHSLPIYEKGLIGYCLHPKRIYFVTFDGSGTRMAFTILIPTTKKRVNILAKS